jgi:aminoglycoside phosphotransferase (APT) family kinase protein
LADHHGDLRAANLLWTADGRLSAIIDWDDLVIADPGYDLAYVVFELGGYPATEFDLGRMAAFSRSYRDALVGMNASLAQQLDLLYWMQLHVCRTRQWLTRRARVSAVRRRDIERWLAAAELLVRSPKAQLMTASLQAAP